MWSKVVSRLLLFGLLVCDPIVLAQMTTGAISGVVRDATGAVLPGVTVTVRNMGTAVMRTTLSDDKGRYHVLQLSPGAYEVQAELPGFQTGVRSGLKLAVGQEAAIDLVLNVGEITEKVVVTGEAPLVDLSSGTLSGLVDDRKIRDLPLNGRNFVDLALLQPGVKSYSNMNLVAGMHGTWMSSNGAPVRSNTFLLDGASMSDMHSAGAGSVAGTSLGVEAIREFRIVTNAYSAENGRTMGSVVNIVTRSGTNEFHGSVFEFHRNSALDARNFFDPLADPPPFKRNQFGFALGGPIRKDKTFFFGTYEGLKERLGESVVSRVPSVAARQDRGLVPQIASSVKPYLNLFPLPNGADLGGGAALFTFPFKRTIDEHLFQVRIDHYLSDKDAFFGRHTFDDALQVLPFNFPLFEKRLSSRSQFLTLEEKKIISPTLLNIFRFSFSRTVLRSPAVNRVSPNLAFLPGLETGSINIGGLTAMGPDNTTPGFAVRNLFTYSDDIAYSSGAHSVKAGMLVDRYQDSNLTSTNWRGVYSFAGLTAFLQNEPFRFLIATPGSKLFRSWRYLLFGFYVQDDIRISSRLTWNVGLRYEFTTTFEEVHGASSAIRNPLTDAEFTIGPPFKNPTLKNFSPRLGFAWDPFGTGKTALRGGFGVFYDVANYGSSLRVANTGMPPLSSQTLVLNPAFPAPKLAAGRIGRSARGVMQYEMEQPHMLHYNLNLQRQLPGDVAVTVGYAGSRGINLIQVKEGNPVLPQILPDGRKFFPVGAPRRNPNWDFFEGRLSGGNSWYNSFQFSALKRLSRGLQFQSSYTFSRVIDDTQGQLGADNTGSGIDPLDRKTDQGLAAFHVKHNWTFNWGYDLPFGQQLTGLASLLKGWQLNGIVSVSSGTPFPVGVTADRSRSGVLGGGGGRPNLKPGVNIKDAILGGPDRYFDTSVFELQPAGFLGNAGRNILVGPGLATVDFSVLKNTRVRFLGEQGNVMFRAEFFNIFNRPNFGLPADTVFAGGADNERPLSTAGRITRTITSSRQVQFGLKIMF